MIDEKDFFREATLRICSSLEIEKALWGCHAFVRDFIPSDFISMSVFEPELGMVEVIARIDVRGRQFTPIKRVLPSPARDIYNSVFRKNRRPPHVFIINRIDDDPIARPLFIEYGANTAVMIMHARLEEQVLGYISIGNYRGEGYAQRHADLFSLLNDPFAVALSNYLRYREVSRLRDLLVDDNSYLRSELRQHIGDEIVGANFGLKQVMDMIHQVAPLTSPVLLLGETGTGKELIANAIHNLSPRKDGPLIKVNCGAIPDTLMDSELFGHEKGAFTGALIQKRGRFERAHGGTIFLDEIGELPLGAQVRLLRVVQEKEIERVGGTSPIHTDIRLIAATHRNLEEMLAQGTFREDLYFRLRVFPIQIPPLRERLGDIPALVQHFMQKKSREMGLARFPTLDSRAINQLVSYHWPGNVRELQNVVERALILGKGEPLSFDELGKHASRTEPARSKLLDDDLIFSHVVSKHIIRVLELTKGRVGGEKGAARLLGLNPSTLRKKMRKLGIPFGRMTADRNS